MRARPRARVCSVRLRSVHVHPCPACSRRGCRAPAGAGCEPAPDPSTCARACESAVRSRRRGTRRCHERDRDRPGRWPAARPNVPHRRREPAGHRAGPLQPQCRLHDHEARRHQPGMAVPRQARGAGSGRPRERRARIGAGPQRRGRHASADGTRLSRRMVRPSRARHRRTERAQSSGGARGGACPNVRGPRVRDGDACPDHRPRARRGCGGRGATAARRSDDRTEALGGRRGHRTVVARASRASLRSTVPRLASDARRPRP